MQNQGELIKKNAEMAQKISKLNEQIKNFDAKLGVVNQTKDKIRRDQEKEIIDNAHIDANKNAILSKEREKDRIQKILDTNNISDEAKITLKKDMNRIDGEIAKTEAQNKNLKDSVNKVQNDKINEEINKQKELGDMNKQMIRELDDEAADARDELAHIDKVIGSVQDPAVKAQMKANKTSLQAKLSAAEQEKQKVKEAQAQNEELQKKTLANKDAAAKNQERINEAKHQQQSIKDEMSK